LRQSPTVFGRKFNASATTSLRVPSRHAWYYLGAFDETGFRCATAHQTLKFCFLLARTRQRDGISGHEDVPYYVDKHRTILYTIAHQCN